MMPRQEENENEQEIEVEEQGEDAQIDDLIQAREEEFAKTHDFLIGAALLQVYRQLEDIDNINRIKDAILEYSTFSEGTTNHS